MDSLLNQLAASVSNAEDLEGLTRPILQLLETVTGLESTYLTTVDAQRGVQHILYSRNVRELQIPEGLSVPWEDTLCRRALVEDRPYTDDVAGVWGDSNAAKALGIKTYMSHPVRNLDGGLYGTLCAASDVSRPVSPEVLKVLGMFASLISHQVERERLFNNLRKANETLAAEATTDPLTGVGNRRALIAELKRTLARAHRDGDAVRVAFVDLDGFKRINDVYGHEVGDRFLELLASRLVAGTRSGDFVGRYGPVLHGLGRRGRRVQAHVGRGILLQRRC